MNNKFENDLRECFDDAALFLRGKNVEWNKARKKKERSESQVLIFVSISSLQGTG